MANDTATADARLIPTDFECPPERAAATYYRDRDGAIMPGHAAAYRNDVKVFNAPDDLVALSYEDLTGLKYALMARQRNLQHKGRRCEITEAFSKRLWAEIPTRPEYKRAFGGQR